MIPGGNTRAELVAAIVARLTTERDALPHRGTFWNQGARAGLAQAIDIVTELAGEDESALILCETPEGCTCGAPASTPRGMHHDYCGVRAKGRDDG